MSELEFRYRLARLIAEELSGIISEDDRNELDAWINASSANQKEYRQIAERLKTELAAGERMDVEAEWSAFKKRITPKQTYLRWWYSAAALLLTGVIGALFYINSKKAGSQSAIVAGTEIVKENKAILVLADGRRMNISDTSRSVIMAANGLQITASGNRLEYQQGSDISGADKQYNTLIIPRGAEYQLRLSDGSIAWLNSGSSLTYPVHFDGSSREVQMEGEVCFDVAHVERQPFIVTTRNVSVRVLGTLFNMEAYPDEPVITTLVRGKVEVSDGNRKRTIRPDQQAVIAAGQFDVKEVYAADFVEWTKGTFSFTGVPLSLIMDRLARWYDVEVNFASPAAKKVRFSLEVKRSEDISSVLSKIEKTGRVYFRLDGRKVIVTEQD